MSIFETFITSFIVFFMWTVIGPIMLISLLWGLITACDRYGQWRWRRQRAEKQRKNSTT